MSKDKPKHMIHFFQSDITSYSLPERFTFPFHYTPHPLCIQAAEELMAYLHQCHEWKDELEQGKMFGVLIVKDNQDRIGYLAAFSGNLAGSNCHPFFVPPVYDLLNPDGYFKEEEMQISIINREIEQQEQDAHYQQSLFMLNETKQQAESELDLFRSQIKERKNRRKEARQKGNLSEEEIARLNKESQFDKAELRRKEQYWKEEIRKQEEEISRHQAIIHRLKEERKKRSIALQTWIFHQYHMRNAFHETQDLCEIFAKTPQCIPPAGAGECAAPKLLQYAYLNQLHPIAMAEFWWGNSPKGEIRHHGHYYPSCRHKCEPILNFMLQGLEVDPNPLLHPKTSCTSLEYLYEDEYLCVIHKPAGILSVPGKTGQTSVYDILKEAYPHATGPLLVHRLDMDTSGILLAAKTQEIHAMLQEQFESRSVRKKYIALLAGVLEKSEKEGFIRLPLSPDYHNRPLQKVDFEQGKMAVTRYEIQETGKRIIQGKERPFTRIAYYPQTGRTHQLRVHSAHSQGMNMPILGDPLYGQAADRLYLHAEELTFRHPVTSGTIRIQCPCPF